MIQSFTRGYRLGFWSGACVWVPVTAVIIGALSWFGLAVTFTPASPYQTARQEADCPVPVIWSDAGLLTEEEERHVRHLQRLVKRLPVVIKQTETGIMPVGGL